MLRGAAGDGNAAAEAYAALAEFTPLSASLREQLAERLYYGQVPSEAELHAIQDRRGPLTALRAAAQQSWAYTELAPERGQRMRVPNYPKLLDAGLCLLAEARSQPPAECLQVAADVIRLGQDLVPGAPLQAADAAARLNSLASHVVPRCAQAADLASLRRAVHEFHILATHPPPTGTGIELQDLVTAMELRRLGALTNKASPGQVAAAIMARPKLLSAWALHAGATRFRELKPADYPDGLTDWVREADAREQSELPLVAAGVNAVQAQLVDDMRGQALLRMVAIGLATLADRAYRGKLPPQPSLLEDPALRDPFRGAPFGYRFQPDGSELTLWSVGEDSEDDGGSTKWNESGPADVVVRFALSRADVKPPIRK